MKCKSGQYYCNTDKVCKPMPTGFDVPGQNKKPTEVGIGKGVGCNGTEKGEACPVHGQSKCPSMKEETNPKGPIKAFKSPKELAKKHDLLLSTIKKQLEIGTKVEKEHTTSEKEAKIIASQHIEELPNYYTKLKKVEKKTTNESLLVDKILSEIKDSVFNRAFTGEVCPYCGCDPCECEDGQIYSEDTNNEPIDESVRLSAQTGNMIMCMVSWRGKYIGIKMFFPQAKRPGRKEIEIELQKIYPGSKVVNFKISELQPGEPFIQISNRSIEEEVEIEEGMTMKDFKQQRSRQKQKEKRADVKTSTTRRAGIHNSSASPERAARHRANVDPDFEGNDERNYPGGKLSPKKVRKARATGEISEAKKSEVPCNKPKAQAHGSGETGKSHVVKACSGGKEKLIRFGQLGVKGSPKKEGESEEYASRRRRFQTRHAKNIAKGKMSAAYWANKVKW